MDYLSDLEPDLNNDDRKKTSAPARGGPGGSGPVNDGDFIAVGKKSKAKTCSLPIKKARASSYM